ncbi:MAG: type IV pilus secretin PilQ [Neptuniibacter sp.]
MKIVVPQNENTNLGLGKLLRALCLVLTVLVLPKAIAAEVVLNAANFVSLPGGKIELRFDFDSPPPEPQSYLINSPSRLVLDLWGVLNEIENRTLDVKTGLVDVVNFAQTEGRLRVVTNLYEPSSFKTRVEGTSLYVELYNNVTPIDTSVSSNNLVMSKNVEKGGIAQDRTRVVGLDFEREEGEVGRVTINLSDDKAGVDIVEEGNNVVVNLSGASLPETLQQRVDVQDFVTPLMFIDAMGNKSGTTILLKPSSEPYEYLAYQTDNRLIIDFKPVTLAEKEEREKDLFPFSGEPIDLNFQNVELRSVLQIIAEVAELNLVVSDSVKGNITLRLKNVPWDQALDIVLKTRGLDQRTVGNVLMIAPAAEISNREALELESQKKVEELAPIRTQFIQVEYRKASEMLASIQAAKLISERGFILADNETNVLMLRETDAAISEVRKTLKRFDVEVEQVLIEARIVNARSSASKELGIRWGFGYNDVDNGQGWIVNPELGSINFGSPPSDVGLNVDLGADTTGQIAIGFAPGTSSMIALELSALESDGQAEVVAQPKVLTTNGTPAAIKSGSQIPFQSVEDGEVSVEFKDVVLGLSVTPQINPGDKIALDLDISQNSVGTVLPNGEVSIDTNTLTTSVVVPDGRTIVLGGVFRNESTESVGKIPLLGDLPVMGALFRNKQNTYNKSELLIFITPKLVRESLSQSR